LNSLQLWSWYFNIAATLALLVRLAYTRLIPVYRWFSLYLLTDAVQQLWRVTVPLNTTASGWIYVAGNSLKAVLAMFVILELYRWALAEHAALAKFGQNAVIYALGAAAVIALAGLMLDPPISGKTSVILFSFLRIERTMDIWALLYLLTIGVFLSWFPVRMKRNVAVYMAGFGVYFLARSVGLLLTNVLPKAYTTGLSTAMLFVSFGCLLVWTVALGRAGESVGVVTGMRSDPTQLKRVTGQLEAINRSLARLVRSS
jgi:hypothetical protein